MNTSAQLRDETDIRNLSDELNREGHGLNGQDQQDITGVLVEAIKREAPDKDAWSIALSLARTFSRSSLEKILGDRNDLRQRIGCEETQFDAHYRAHD